MRRARCLAVLVAALAASLSAADRKWQTGTWTDVGLKRTAAVGDPVHERMPPGFNKPVMTEVATYVIETEELRLELQDMMAVGREGFDLNVTIGKSVTFRSKPSRPTAIMRSEEHTSELQSLRHLVCRLL